MLFLINTHKHNQAYTVVELIVVIVIISILAAIAIPRYFNNKISAYRAVNLATVATLNDAVQDAYAQYSLLGPNPTTKGVGAYTSIVPVLINLDNNSSLTYNNYLGLYNGYPIGSARANYTSLDPGYGQYGLQYVTNFSFGAFESTSGVDAHNMGFYGDILYSTTFCATLFNVLLRKSSVQACNSTSNSYYTSGYDVGSSTSTYATVSSLAASTSITLTGGALVPISSGSTVVTPSSSQSVSNTAITPVYGGTNIASAGCIFQLTASTSTTPFFYIYYNPVAGMFYSIERTP